MTWGTRRFIESTWLPSFQVLPASNHPSWYLHQKLAAKPTVPTAAARRCLDLQVLRQAWNLGSLIFSENTSRNISTISNRWCHKWNLTFPIGCMTTDPRWPWAPTSWKMDTLNLLICNICTFPVTPCDLFPNARSAASENCNFETKICGYSPCSSESVPWVVQCCGR